MYIYIVRYLYIYLLTVAEYLSLVVEINNVFCYVVCSLLQTIFSISVLMDFASLIFP